MSNGEQLMVLRWVSPDVEGATAPTLFHTAGPTSLHTAGSTSLHTDDGSDDVLPDNAQSVVSEPLKLHWNSHNWVEAPSGVTGVFRRDKAPEFMPLDELMV